MQENLRKLNLELKKNKNKKNKLNLFHSNVGAQTAKANMSAAK